MTRLAERIADSRDARRLQLAANVHLSHAGSLNEVANVVRTNASAGQNDDPVARVIDEQRKHRRSFLGCRWTTRSQYALDARAD